MFASFSPTPGASFPGPSRPTGPQRYDSLNATQTAAKVPPLFLAIEEELHDSRRVHSHGQEEDLKYALNRAINRISELSTMLQDALKTQSDLETQLGVTKSNLKLVIANNEMLEDALKRDSSIRDVGWNRGSMSGKRGATAVGSRSTSIDQEHDSHSPLSPTVGSSPTIANQIPSGAASPVQPGGNTPQDSKFFRFRFNSSSGSRPGTPVVGQTAAQLTSPSMPTLPMHASDKERELEREMGELAAKLEEERKKSKQACDDKAALEEELESLSAALFEEANKMVATERMKLHETNEELQQAQLEKEALRSALKLIEGENKHLRTSSQSMGDLRGAYGSEVKSRSRSSSVTGVKSRPVSAVLNGVEKSASAPVVPPPRQDSRDLSALRADRGASPTAEVSSPPPEPVSDLAASSSSVSLDEDGYGTPEEEMRESAVSPPAATQKGIKEAEQGSSTSSTKPSSSPPPSSSSPSPDESSPTDTSSPTDIPPTTSSQARQSSPPPAASLEPPPSESESPEGENESEKTPAPRSPLVLPPADPSPWAS